jgi:hypothetical protein
MDYFLRRIIVSLQRRSVGSLPDDRFDRLHARDDVRAPLLCAMLMNAL